MLIPKTCVIGAKGFIGGALIRAYRSYYPDAIGSDYRDPPPYVKIDLSDYPRVNHLDLSQYAYAVIAAAYPNLLLCEKNPKVAHQINVKGTLQLVEQFVERKIVPILFSTDYVFDGMTGGYDENATVSPVNEYGRQKAELEQLLLKNFEGQYLLIRLSKVYGLQKGDGTLIDQMIQSLLNKVPIRAAVDQIFSPVAVNDVVNAIIKLQTANTRGIYHICSAEAWSRYDLAKFICEKMGTDKKLVVPISLNDLNEPFTRPKRTDMVNRKLLTLPMKPLRTSVQCLIQQYLGRM